MSSLRIPLALYHGSRLMPKNVGAQTYHENSMRHWSYINDINGNILHSSDFVVLFKIGVSWVILHHSPLFWRNPIHKTIVFR
jgi:hypothetical protein